MHNYLKTDNTVEEKIHIGLIPAIVFRPKYKKKPYPTIILYHGWGSNKENQRIRGLILSVLGYQVIIPDAIHHGERNPVDYQLEENYKKYFWDTIFNNIEESGKLIKELILNHEADPVRIGVIGNSMGGFTAAGIFTHNPSLKTLVVLNGSCGWQNSNQIFKASIRRREEGDFTEIEEKANRLDPMNNLELLKDRPILMLHGDKDSSVDIESQKKFYNKIMPLYEDKNKIKLIEYPDLNHFVTTNMMEESIIWFNRYL